MADRFFTPEPLSPGEFHLRGAEAHHLTAVRRFKPGGRIVLFNGDGREYPAEILEAGRKFVLLNVLAVSAISREAAHAVAIAAALPKGDRGEFLVEKLVELGVARFIPLRTERTIVQPRDSRLEKLHQAVIEASKQCGRNVLTRIDPLTDWPRFVAAAADGPRAILHPGGASRGRLPLDTDCTIAVGPEGGFTDGELAAAEAAGWERVSLGPRTLRVETAAIAAAARILGA